MRWPTSEEFLVIGVVILGLVLFEMGPKLLNVLKNRRKSDS
jgi:hypothetical protein